MTLRIIIGIGQPFVCVMGQMGVAKPAIRNQEIERGEHQSRIQPWVARRVTMNDFMLQGRLQRDHHRQTRHRQPKRGEEQSQPSAIAPQKGRQCRPFGHQRRALNLCHGRRVNLFAILVEFRELCNLNQ